MTVTPRMVPMQGPATPAAGAPDATKTAASAPQSRGVCQGRWGGWGRQVKADGAAGSAEARK